MTTSVDTCSAEQPAASFLDALRAAVVARVGSLLRAGGIDPADVTCTVEPSWPHVHVVLSGPPVPAAVEHVLGVRVLDAVRASGRTFGEVDVTYRAAVGTDAPDR